MGVLVVDQKLRKCASSFTFKAVSAVTRSVPSSGKSSPTSMASIPLVPTTVTPTSSWSASMCTTTRPPAAATCPVPSLWTWSLVLWTLFVLVHSVSSSAPTTLCSARLVLVTTRPRVTTPRVPSSSTLCSMLSARRPSPVIASRASSSATPLAEVLVPVWELSSSRRSVRSTPTVWCSHSLLCHHQKCPTLLWSHTTPLSLCTSLWRTLTSACALTTRPCTTSASVLSS